MNDHIKDDQFTAFIDGELDAEKNEWVKIHLLSCSSCAQEVECFQEVKIRYSRIPRRSAPPQLLALLRKQQKPRLSLGKNRWAWVSPQTFMRAAAFAVLLVVATLFFINNRSRNDEFVDLDSLLVAHSKYQGESLVPHADMSQSNYSARLASFYQDEN